MLEVGRAILAGQLVGDVNPMAMRCGAAKKRKYLTLSYTKITSVGKKCLLYQDCSLNYALMKDENLCNCSYSWRHGRSRP